MQEKVTDIQLTVLTLYVWNWLRILDNLRGKSTMQNEKNKRVEPNGLFYFGKEIIELQRDKNFAANKTV